MLFLVLIDSSVPLGPRLVIRLDSPNLRLPVVRLSVDSVLPCPWALQSKTVWLMAPCTLPNVLRLTVLKVLG